MTNSNANAHVIAYTQALVDADLDVRQCIRRAAGLQNGTPIVVVAGCSRPALEGKPGYHTTPSGKTIVHHPNAYKWRTVYHYSTYRVEVGWAWVRRHCPVPFRSGVAA